MAKASAKINPCLKIQGIRDDGYHELVVTYLSVDLYDEITFDSIAERKIKVKGPSGIPPKKNLCTRAARKLKERCKPTEGVSIAVKKNIPVGGGLGGGSSDAAATLAVLNELWDCKLDDEELMTIGAELGADVPFFVRGGYRRGEGIGDRLKRLPRSFPYENIFLFVPPFSLSTPRVYARFDKLSPRERGRKTDSTNPCFIPDPPGKPNLINDLEKPALALRPRLKTYLQEIRNVDGIRAAAVSGSGSTIFALPEPSTDSTEFKRHLDSKLSSELSILVVHPTNHGHTIEEKGSLDKQQER